MLLHHLNLPVTGRFKLFKRGLRGSKFLDGIEHQPLLGFLRVFHMSKEDLDKWMKAGNDTVMTLTATFGTFGDIDKKVSSFLGIRASLLLRGYPSQDQLNTRSHSIQRLLKSEQDILQSYVLD
jgi:ABC-type transporter Mla subunit MlaD